MNQFVCSNKELYERNVGIIKQYTPDLYKLIYMRSVRISGYEERKPTKKRKKNSASNNVKLRESLIRSRSNVYELALCNSWTHFVTFTLSQDKLDRYNLNAAVSKISKWINNLNYRQSINIKYLIIPEPHKDDAWHFHCLMMGVPSSLLVPFLITDNIPIRIKGLIKDGHAIYNFPLYQEKFGWVTVEEIRDNERTAKYITKYITKELLASRIALNHHVFYASKGLQRAKTLYRAELRREFTADYENEYVRVKQFDNLEEPLQYFCDEEP